MQRFVCASIMGFLGIMAAVPAGAAEPEPAGTVQIAAPSARANSINGNPFGFLIGSYALNYERLLGGQHGFLVEGEYMSIGGDGNSATSYGGNAGYRWHWSGGQNSGFIGANVGYHHGGAESTIEGMSHSLAIDTVYVVANIGRRWAWSSGFNITFRIGGGRAWHDVTAESSEPGAAEAEQAIEDLLEFIPIALDGELSVGYSF